MWALLAANGYRILWRVGVAVALVTVFYAAILKPFLKPTPTTTVESGGVNYSYDIHPTFGCMRIPVVKESIATSVINKVTPVVNAVKTAVKK